MKLRRISTLFLTATLAALVAAPALSAQSAITGYTGGSAFQIFYTGSSGDAVGFSFTAVGNSSVSHLGVLNLNTNPQVGLQGSHQVGLWRNSDQSLLGSVTVNPGSSLIAGWRYESLASLLGLTAGERYTIAAVYSFTGGSGDQYVSNPGTMTFDPRISGPEAVFPDAANLGFVFPTSASPGNLARLGPNMIFANTVVPEPATVLLLAGGLFAIAIVARRRQLGAL